MPEDKQTLKEFAGLVAEMRAAQIAFFSNRSKQALRLAKVLESKVDYLCKQHIEDKQPPPTQSEILFY